MLSLRKTDRVRFIVFGSRIWHRRSIVGSRYYDAVYCNSSIQQSLVQNSKVTGHSVPNCVAITGAHSIFICVFAFSFAVAATTMMAVSFVSLLRLVPASRMRSTGEIASKREGEGDDFMRIE